MTPNQRNHRSMQLTLLFPALMVNHMHLVAIRTSRGGSGTSTRLSSCACNPTCTVLSSGTRKRVLIQHIGHLEALYVQQLTAALPSCSLSTGSSPVATTPSNPPTAPSALPYYWDAPPQLQHNFSNCNNFLMSNPKRL